MPTRSRRPLIVAGLLSCLLLGGTAAWLLWPVPPPPPPEEAQSDGDTGLTRDQTEAMMRSIGYVQ